MAFLDTMLSPLRSIRVQPDELARQAWEHIRATDQGRAQQAQLATAKLLLAAYLRDAKK